MGDAENNQYSSIPENSHGNEFNEAAAGASPTAPRPESRHEEFKKVDPLVRAPIKAGCHYYLVSRRWYTEWLSWVGHQSVQSPQMRPSQEPNLPTLERQDSEGVGSASQPKRTRTHSWSKEGPGKIDNSELLEEGTSNKLKKSLNEHSDYEIVPEDAWNLLCSWYGGGPEIKRRAIQRKANDSPMVELHGFSLKIYRSSDLNGTPFETTESKVSTVRTLKEHVCKELDLDLAKVRIWDYFEKVVAKNQQLEKMMDTTLEDCRLNDGHEILLEEQNEDGTWPQDKESNTTSTATSSYSYSTSSYSNSSYWSDAATAGDPPQRGAVGLTNLGNTCFMNSSLQCLSNIPALREYFISEEYVKHKNPDAYKTQGRLAEAFAQLLTMMWKEDTIRVAPRNFKYQIGQFAEQFLGYGQQDSMELIEYVLDGLKEDCNSVRGKKQYVEVKEAEGRPDEEVAQEALDAYRSRSNSRIDDLFVGLFKSVVRCPEPEDKCGRKSVTFDPFLSAKLSLVSSVEQRQQAVALTVVRDQSVEVQGVSGDGPAQDPVKLVNLKVNKDAPMKQLIEEVCKEVQGLKAEHCVIVKLGHSNSHLVGNFAEESDRVDSFLTPKDTGILYEVTDAAPFGWGPGSDNYGASSSSAGPAPDGDASPTSPSRPSSCGAVIYHTQASTYYKYSASWVGTPLLLSLPNGVTGNWLYNKVARRLKETLLDETTTTLPAWTLKKISKPASYSYSCTGGIEVEKESEEPLELKECREYFAIQWEDGATLPARLRTDASKSSYEKSEPERELSQLLGMFVEDEQLGKDDTWYCNKCKEHKEAWKKLQFHICPPVLVLQLKRFQYTATYRDRVNNPVSFPLEGLDVTPYCTAWQQAQETPKVYDLAAVSKHIGSLGGGHYVAYCRSSEDGKWYSFDDGTVRQVTASEVEEDKVGAYVLFYIRRDFSPKTFGTTASKDAP